MIPSFILAKKEVTYGVDPVATAANVIWGENVRHRILGAAVKTEPSKPGLAPTVDTVPYGQAVEVTFEVPLSASGTAGTAPKWGPLAQACSFSETLVAVTSVTYARRVDPAVSDSLAITYRTGRRRHLILGARGRMGLKLVAGQRPMLTFTFVGLYSPVAIAAQPVQADATWTGWATAQPIAQGRTTFAFNAVNTALRELTQEPSENTLFNDLPHQENVQLLGELAFTGRLKATTPLPSALNLETLWEAGTIVTAAVVHESVAGSIVTINMKGQIDQPEYAEEKGEDVFTVPFKLKPSAMANDDDISIVLT